MGQGQVLDRESWRREVDRRYSIDSSRLHGRPVYREKISHVATGPASQPKYIHDNRQNSLPIPKALRNVMYGDQSMVRVDRPEARSRAPSASTAHFHRQLANSQFDMVFFKMEKSSYNR